MGFCPRESDFGVTLNRDTVIETVSGSRKASFTHFGILTNGVTMDVALPLVVNVSNLNRIKLECSDFVVNINHRLFHQSALVTLQQVRDNHVVGGDQH